jgi:hypothetical protein
MNKAISVQNPGLSLPSQGTLSVPVHGTLSVQALGIRL